MNSTVNRNDVLFGLHPAAAFAILFLAFFLARTVVTFPIEHVDSMIKYDAAARIAEGSGLERLLRDQHTMRWVETLPQAAVTWVTGHRYEGMYLLPLAMFAFYCALFMVAASRFLNRGQVALLGFLLFIEPIALNHTGQLLNPPFGVAFTLAGIVLLSREGRPGPGRVMAAAVLFFCAYGAHSTYLAFAGGAFWFLALYHRQYAMAMLFGATILLLILLEIMSFNLLSGGELALGRFEALSESKHMEKVDSVWPSMDVGTYLLKRWARASMFSQFIFTGLGVLAILSLVRSRRGESGLDPFTCCLLFVSVGYVLAITLAVRDINPVRPIVPTRTMYLEPLSPFAIFACVVLLARFEAGISARLRPWIFASAVLLMSVLFLFMVSGKGNLGAIIDARTKAFFWYSHPALMDYRERIRTGELKIKGLNRYSMALLARYPGRIGVKEKNKIMSVPDPAPTALCVAHLRRLPLERNYFDCEGFEPKYRTDRWK